MDATELYPMIEFNWIKFAMSIGWAILLLAVLIAIALPVMHVLYHFEWKYRYRDWRWRRGKK